MNRCQFSLSNVSLSLPRSFVLANTGRADFAHIRFRRFLSYSFNRLPSPIIKICLSLYVLAHLSYIYSHYSRGLAPNLIMTGRVDTGDRNAVPQTAALRLRAVHRRSAFADFGVENAAACINACFSSLVLNVEDACRRLQQPEYQRASLWDLYCCDSVNCGVYIGNVGQSRKFTQELANTSSLP